MLAVLLRRVYLVELIAGAALGFFVAEPLAAQDRLFWLLVPLGAVLLPGMLHFLVIALSMLRSRSEGCSAHWWQAFWGEWRASLVVFVLRQPWASQRPTVLPALPGQHPAHSNLPVLLVHGFICNYRVWDDVVLALRTAGHPVLAINLEPLFTSIDDYAAPIEQAVTELLAQSSASQVALVGHSMGGLAIRSWLRAHGGARAAQVITLGTPHWGTRSVRPGASATLPNVTQMAWHSAWLQALSASETSATRALMQIVLARQDNIVYPQREQTLPGATVTEFDGCGHLALCLNPAVIGWLVQQLDAFHAPR